MPRPQQPSSHCLAESAWSGANVVCSLVRLPPFGCFGGPFKKTRPWASGIQGQLGVVQLGSSGLCLRQPTFAGFHGRVFCPERLQTEWAKSPCSDDLSPSAINCWLRALLFFAQEKTMQFLTKTCLKVAGTKRQATWPVPSHAAKPCTKHGTTNGIPRGTRRVEFQGTMSNSSRAFGVQHQNRGRAVPVDVPLLARRKRNCEWAWVEKRKWVWIKIQPPGDRDLVLVSYQSSILDSYLTHSQMDPPPPGW